MVKMQNKWRDNILSEVKTHLEKQIEDSAKHKEAYNKSINPANAQLWVAVAILSKQLFELNRKVGMVEKDVIDFDKKALDNINNSLKELEKRLDVIKELENKITEFKKESVKPIVKEEKPKMKGKKSKLE